MKMPGTILITARIAEKQGMTMEMETRTFTCTWCNIAPVVKRPVAYNGNLRDPVVVRCPECGVMVLSENGEEPAIAMWNKLQERELEDIRALWRKAMRDYYRDKERI